MDADKKTILIIEDEMDMRFFLKTLAETNGFKPVMARNGQEGIQKLSEIYPDLIILDVMMPEKGGALVYHELKCDQATREIPVIILSGVPKHTFFHYLKMLEARLNAVIPVPSAYVEKPPEPTHLLALIKQSIT